MIAKVFESESLGLLSFVRHWGRSTVLDRQLRQIHGKGVGAPNSMESTKEVGVTKPVFECVNVDGNGGSLKSQRFNPVKLMFQQWGYVKVQIGDDMETLLDQIMNVCSIDFADWSEESGQRGVELVCRPEDVSKTVPP
ncbi:hypothetical protein BU15DRAFT_69634 [Melanogaster broomeanus]|nr:hypothetical protein BU15DRAFT_69634 [Melanogaster broomeanus]